eukprot:14552202-Alexandrium_andersonii.AAC.1
MVMCVGGPWHSTSEHHLRRVMRRLCVQSQDPESVCGLRAQNLEITVCSHIWAQRICVTLCCVWPGPDTQIGRPQK